MVNEMKCPKCKSQWLGVIKTTNLPHSKLRMRICYKCKNVFETIEKIIEESGGDNQNPQQNLFGKKN